MSLPTFFTGLFLIYLFYFLLGWAPSPLGWLDIIYLPPPHVTGFFLIDSLLSGDTETFWAAVRQLILPAITLGLFALAPIARMTRATMLNSLGSDFIRTARANGLSQRKILINYAFLNASLPLLTTLGMVFSFLLGANVLVEKVFSWPGIGSFAIEGWSPRRVTWAGPSSTRPVCRSSVLGFDHQQRSGASWLRKEPPISSLASSG